MNTRDKWVLAWKDLIELMNEDALCGMFVVLTHGSDTLMDPHEDDSVLVDQLHNPQQLSLFKRVADRLEKLSKEKGA